MARNELTPYSRVSLQMWPETDRRLFLELQGDGDPFSVHATTNRRPRTWKWLEYSYSHWLGYVMTRHSRLLTAAPHKRVRQDTVEEYRRLLAASSKDMTVSIELQRLYLVIRDMAPEEDWQWLWRASRRLFKAATAVAPLRRTVDATTLYMTGEALMRRARQQVDDLGYVSENAAKTYRKGLEIALPALVPERKRIWQGLRLGVNIKKSGPVWRIILEEDDTKSGEPYRLRIPARLWPWIDDYIDRFRPALPGAQSHNGFWPARSGRPMSGSTIYQSLTRTTNAELGEPVTPHEIRRSVATHCDRTHPYEPEKAQRLLAHSDHRITDTHYIVPLGYAGEGLMRAVENYGLPNPVTNHQGTADTSLQKTWDLQSRHAIRKARNGAAS